MVFLAHSSGDKPYVREVSRLLKLDGFDLWIDEEKLIPGQDWELEIEQAIRKADVIAVFLSSKSVDTAGYVQKEIRVALDAVERQPYGSIGVIPVKLDDHEVPQNLRHLHWIDPLRTQWQPRMCKAIAWHDDLDVLQQFSIGDRYLLLQSALLVRNGEYAGLSLAQIGPTGEAYIEYLVRGQHSAGGRYYGLAQMRISGKEVRARTQVEGEVYDYEGHRHRVQVKLAGYPIPSSIG